MEDSNNFNNLLEGITEEHIIKLLESYGAPPFKVKEKEIWFKTICHGGDSHKLCYFRDTKDFYCYTNCGKMSVFNLIQNVENCDFKTALKKIRGIAGISYRIEAKIGLHPGENPELALLKKREEKLKNRKKTKDCPLVSIKEDILNYFDDNVFYEGWIKEGITIEAMQELGIKWYGAEQHIIIPHRDICGNLVGIRRRSLQEKDSKNKYMPEDQILMTEDYNYAHSLGMNLYGLYECQDAIRRLKTAIIVEGEKSVLLSKSYYGEDSVAIATCGFNISSWQRDMLLRLGVERVIVAFDNDFLYDDFVLVDEEELEKASPEFKAEYARYKKYIKRIDSLCKKFAPYCDVYKIFDTEGLLGKKDSPFDKGKDVLEKLLENKKEITA